MPFSGRQLNDREFKHYCTLVYDECGIHLTDEKRQLVNARLSKRLRNLGVEPDAYLRIIERDPEERCRFVDAISTNHTRPLAHRQDHRRRRHPSNRQGPAAGCARTVFILTGLRWGGFANCSSRVGVDILALPT